MCKFGSCVLLQSYTIWKHTDKQPDNVDLFIVFTGIILNSRQQTPNVRCFQANENAHRVPAKDYTRHALS